MDVPHAQSERPQPRHRAAGPEAPGRGARRLAGPAQPDADRSAARTAGCARPVLPSTWHGAVSGCTRHAGRPPDASHHS